MECDICGSPGTSAPLHCITCARSYLEEHRLQLAKALIEQDDVEKYVKAVIEGSEEKKTQHVSLVDSKGGLLVDRQECSNNVELQRTKAETAEVNDRLRLIAEQAQILRVQMEATRKQIEVQRKINAQRKSDMSSATYGIDSRRANELDKVQQNIKRMDYKSDKVHHDIMEMRIYLCGTAARLAGLKMTKRRTKEGDVKEVYAVGPGSRIRIYDLRDMNDAPPDQLSASLGAVAQLLVRVAAYLGIRLPAEITLPHNDYPQPTIFSPSSSYQGKRVPFPGTTPSHSSSNSPEASRTLEIRNQLPKPRVLFTDRPLNHLAAEDPPVYSSFIEGASLLAYNVAWLCRSQGLKDQFTHWEDVCSMGKNLRRLLILQETKLSPRPENPLDKDIAPTKTNSRLHVRRGPVGFGELSHATAHSFLGTAQNAQYLSGWGLTPTKITDELKTYLYTEQQAQEWDKLDQKEWEDMEDAMAEDPVLVGEKRQGIEDRGALARSPAGTREGRDTQGGEEKKSVNGWTRVKSRNEEGSKKGIPE